MFFSQIFSYCIVATIVFSGGLIGLELADNLENATLPTAFLIIGSALFSYPSSKIMQAYGRKNGFLLGNIFALLGVSLASFAIIHEDFYLFCGATFLLGMNLSFVNQYRFAVVEGVEEKFKNKALSFLIISSMIGAIISLQIIPFSRYWFEIDFLGSYLFLAFMLLMAFMSLLFYKNQKENIENTKQYSSTTNKLLSIKFIFTVLVSMMAYMVMSSIMVATPLYLKQTIQSSTYLIAIVIQAHMVSMFLPSLFSGFLMDKITKVNLIKVGVLFNILAIASNVIHPSYYSILIGLILLGIGWNFMFISSSLYLVEHFKDEIKYKAQGINELFTFSSQAIASILSGVLLYNFGWQVLNVLFVPLLIVVFLFAFSNRLK